MDTLALLCNLHADGPTTLQRLRREGCESLATLLTLGAVELGQRLDWSEREAERFLREAVHLAERIDEPIAWESEDAGFQEEPQDEDVRQDELTEEGFEAFKSPKPAEVERVLGAWRDLDRADPPQASEPELPSYGTDSPPASAADHPLARVELAGLEAPLVARLAELGLLSLEELSAAPTTELAQRLPLAYSRVTRLQFLARRELDRVSHELVPQEQPTELLPAPPREATVPRSEAPAAPESAGPFA